MASFEKCPRAKPMKNYVELRLIRNKAYVQSLERSGGGSWWRSWPYMPNRQELKDRQEVKDWQEVKD
jgi:hypothetical protein